MNDGINLKISPFELKQRIAREAGCFIQSFLRSSREGGRGFMEAEAWAGRDIWHLGWNLTAILAAGFTEWEQTSPRTNQPWQIDF